MSRWKVEFGLWWVAMQVDERGREIPGTAKRFPTHAEALAYADRQARTREYVLPRSNSTPKRAAYQWHIKEVKSGALLTRAKRTNDGYRMTQKIHIGRKDLVEVAMILLAHAERMEE